MAQIPYKIYLDESELPQAWYNLRADMKNKPAPLLNPATHQPMTFDELRPVFCDELVKQEHFPAFRIGQRILVNRAGLQRWIDAQCGGDRAA